MKRNGQDGHRVRFEWGPMGLRTLAPLVDVVVVVDVLSFTTCVDVALGRGAVLFPYKWRDGSEGAFAESVDADLRAHVRRAMGVPLTDTYSSQEVGCMAIQCPGHDHYHVQAETVRLEVLDDRDQPCAPGQIGRVVVSSLHNFASPLIRYEIGDYAEVGAPCFCGRQLPTLKRILGRERNLLVLPNGERRWPAFGQSDHPHDLPPFFQFQIVQRSLEEIELNVVRDSLAGSAEKEQARRYLHKMLGYPFKVTINEVDSIPRSKSGKFEDFRSDVGLALDS